MSFHTKITSDLHIAYPIIQAGMAGGVTTPELVAAVSEAGGLGTIGAGYMKPEDLRKDIQKVRTLTDKPFAVNLFVSRPAFADKNKIMEMERVLAKYFAELEVAQPEYNESNLPNFAEQIQVVIEEHVPVFSFTFGLLEEKWIKELKAIDTYIIGTATTVEEGKLLEDSGVDAIVAQGSEAGGHRGSFSCEAKKALVGTMALVPQMVDALSIPVIAAGGIMEARGFVASLALGASAVQLGTAFLTAKESGTNLVQKEAIFASNETSTVLTKVFSGKWARGIENRFIQEMKKYEQKIPEYPIQHVLTQALRKEAGKQQRSDFMSLWSGQAASLAKDEGAKEIVERIVNGAKDVIHLLNRIN